MNTKNKIMSATTGLVMLMTAACGPQAPKPDVRTQFTEYDRTYGIAASELHATEAGFEKRQDVNKDGMPDIVYHFKTKDDHVLRYYVKAEVTPECRMLGWSTAQCVERGMYRALPQGGYSIYQRMK